jgi:hypothetical protein
LKMPWYYWKSCMVCKFKKKNQLEPSFTIPFSSLICYTNAAVRTVRQLISHVSGFVLRAHMMGEGQAKGDGG